MKVKQTPFDGLLIIEPDVFEDSRGFFLESYHKEGLQKAGVYNEFVQDNQSHSVKYVVRGLHFQLPPYAQTKLVQAIYGTIFDVVVDLRKDKPTYRKVFCMELSAASRVQLLIPKGFAHGFSVLTDTAGVLYKCDEYYRPGHNAGIRFDDPLLAIDWKVPADKAIVSDRDLGLPLISESEY